MLNIDKYEKKKKYKIKYSYGIICFRFNYEKELEYLMIMRKNSYAFSDFIFGNYKLFDILYIKKMFSRMTKKEKYLLYINDDFNTLWKLVWKDKFFFKSNYINGYKKFKIMKQGYFKDNIFYDLKIFLDSNSSKYKNCEWGFPKGKLEKNEDKIFCALREFEEECAVEKYNFLNITPIYENHRGINNVNYKTYLYFAMANENTFFDKKKIDLKEVSEVKWFTKNKMNETLRNYQSSITKTLEIAEENILKYFDNNFNLIDKTLINYTVLSNFNNYKKIFNENYIDKYIYEYICPEELKINIMENNQKLKDNDLNILEQDIFNMMLKSYNIKSQFSDVLYFEENVNEENIVSEIKNEKLNLDYSNLKKLFENDDSDNDNVQEKEQKNMNYSTYIYSETELDFFAALREMFKD